MESLCYIKLFGGPVVEHRGRVVGNLGSRKVATLLAHLGLSSDRVCSREALAEMLWPDDGPDVTRDRFRQALSVLRRALEPEEGMAGKILFADRNGVRLCPETVAVDVVQFERLILKARREKEVSQCIATLTEAVELARHELLPGYYEERILGERNRVEEMLQEGLGQLSTLYESMNDFPSALESAKRALALDILREDGHLRMIALYGRMGRMADAVRQYRELEKLLREELDSVPSAETQKQFATIKETFATVADTSVVITKSVPLQNTPLSIAIPPTREGVPELESEGGAVRLGSDFYLVREGDREFEVAVRRRDSIVLVKGARQVGKTSLLARGLQQARRDGTKVILCDLQKLTSAQLASADTLFLSFAEIIAEQLDLDIDLERFWSVPRGWNVKFERFLRREVFGKVESPVVWGLDEVDRLFAHPFQTEVFGLFRSWHNERSLDPSTYFSRFTLAMAYATEAHLFITDLSQSPFNVGTRLQLEDFNRSEVAEMNRRYGRPLKSEGELERYYALVGGNPYLVRRGLHEMALHGLTMDTLERESVPENGIFGDVLRRLMLALRQDEKLAHVVQDLLNGIPIPDPDSFYRLRSAGLVIGTSEEDARIGRRLYSDYLRRYLR